MDFVGKAEAIERMNNYGAASQPFFFIIDYKQEQIYLKKPEEISPAELLYQIRDKRNVSVEEPGDSLPLEWDVFPASGEFYARGFRTVQQHIFQGNSYLVNLTCRTPVKSNVSLRELFYCARAPYKVWMKNSFLFFSPEIFVRMRDGFIWSYPMKGTADATLPGARESLLGDPKEAAEHATITDLIRNDLSTVAREVTVTRYRYLDEVRTFRGKLLQMSSEIRGMLPPDWKEQLGTILFSLLPAGSITGAPKKKTLEIIAEAEGMERGFYTGIAGYFDGTELDSCVMIRFIEEKEGEFYYRSGGGITSQSRMEEEYKEMIRKIYVPIC